MISFNGRDLRSRQEASALLHLQQQKETNLREAEKKDEDTVQ